MTPDQVPRRAMTGAIRVRRRCAAVVVAGSVRPAFYRRRMERTVPVYFEGGNGHRTPGWQVRERVDSVVNQVLRTHRGRPVDEVAEALRERLRGLGVPVYEREVQRYAKQISRLGAK